MIPKTRSGRLIAATLVFVFGLMLWHGRYLLIEPWRLFGFEIGAGGLRIIQPDSVKIGEPIKIVFAASVTSRRSIKGRWKNVTLHYRLNEGGYQTIHPVERNLLDDKHEDFVFVIPSQAEPGTIDFFFEYIFDGEQSKVPGRKPISVGRNVSAAKAIKLRHDMVAAPWATHNLIS